MLLNPRPKGGDSKAKQHFKEYSMSAAGLSQQRGFAGITALATYLPKNRENNIELMGEAKAKKLGILERPIAEEDETAGDMAYKAAENLFAAYPAIDRQKIRFVLLCIEFPDYILPNTACHLAARLHLPQNCGAVDYNLGCSGYVYGLAMAKGIIEAGISPNVLLLTSNKTSDYTNKQDLNVRPLFGDGATATLLESCDVESELIHSFVLGTDGENYGHLYIPAGGGRGLAVKTPVKTEKDSEGNVRSNYDISMDGNGIFVFTMHTVPKLVDDVLAKANLQRQDLDYCVFHQPSGFMMRVLRKKCRLTDVPAYSGIEHIGNTVSNTIPFGLQSVFADKCPRELKNVMLAGFGVGLSWGGCIANFSCFSDPGDVVIFQ